jgi:predicted metalloprotease with PDZ domain
MQRSRIWMTLLFWSAATAVPFAAQSHHRHRNKALLGVVTVPAEKGARIVHLLKKAPATEAGLEIGDVIVRVGDQQRGKKREKRPLTPRDLDAALRDVAPGDTVTVAIRREKKLKSIRVRLIDRSAYKGDFLKRRQRGTTGFKAPEWFAYAWANVKKGAEPTRTATRGKVVVIHAFQSW